MFDQNAVVEFVGHAAVKVHRSAHAHVKYHTELLLSSGYSSMLTLLQTLRPAEMKVKFQGMLVKYT